MTRINRTRYRLFCGYDYPRMNKREIVLSSNARLEEIWQIKLYRRVKQSSALINVDYSRRRNNETAIAVLSTIEHAEYCGSRFRDLIFCPFTVRFFMLANIQMKVFECFLCELNQVWWDMSDTMMWRAGCEGLPYFRSKDFILLEIISKHGAEDR